jgi:hypothetical protein
MHLWREPFVVQSLEAFQDRWHGGRSSLHHTLRKRREGWGTQLSGWLSLEWVLILGGKLFAVLGGPVGFDFDGGEFAGGVVVEAAPAVVFGFGDESSGYEVAVDVLDFLFEFAWGEDVEVVVAGLPEVVAG